MIAKNGRNVTLEFLHCGVESKMGVILRYNLATHNEQTSKLLCVRNPNYSTLFLPNIALHVSLYALLSVFIKLIYLLQQFLLLSFISTPDVFL